MTYQPSNVPDVQNTLPELPHWANCKHAETLETVTFLSGAVLAVLDGMLTDQRHGVPLKFLTSSLALTAATATSKLEGRMARKADIRDAYSLARPGDARGPDGDGLAFWREVARLRLVGQRQDADLSPVIGKDHAEDVADWLRAGVACARSHGPLAAGVLVMREVLSADNRGERLACLLSDIVLAQALNWKAVLPVTAQHMTKALLRDLVAAEPMAEFKVQKCILRSAEDTIHFARECARRASALHRVAPKLRTKGAKAAVTVFLSEDAVSPSTMLSPMIKGTTIPMTDRAARRFCDRLVTLGVARELTGRSTFRLYGIGP